MLPPTHGIRIPLFKSKNIRNPNNITFLTQQLKELQQISEAHLVLSEFSQVAYDAAVKSTNMEQVLVALKAWRGAYREPRLQKSLTEQPFVLGDFIKRYNEEVDQIIIGTSN